MGDFHHLSLLINSLLININVCEINNRKSLIYLSRLSAYGWVSEVHDFTILFIFMLWIPVSYSKIQEWNIENAITRLWMKIGWIIIVKSSGQICSVSMQRFIEKINPFRRLHSISASVLTSVAMIKSNIGSGRLFLDG